MNKKKILKPIIALFFATISLVINISFFIGFLIYKDDSIIMWIGMLGFMGIPYMFNAFSIILNSKYKKDKNVEKNKFYNINNMLNIVFNIVSIILTLIFYIWGAIILLNFLEAIFNSASKIT